jgi:trigger factor
MQVSVETVSGLERKMTMAIPAAKIDNEVESRLKQTAGRVRIDGFRPGKVPVSVVRQRYGKDVRAEVLNDTLRAVYLESIQAESLEPAGYPSFDVTKNEKGSDVEFVATFEVMPVVELKEFEGLSFEKLSAKIDDEAVDTMVDSLRKQRTEYSAVEREAKNEDRATISFVGKVDGEEFAGGTSESQNVVLGSGSMIAGFESGIEGMKAGEEKTIDVTFPADYRATELAGKAAQFDIKLIEVAQASLPEVNEEFYQAFGTKDATKEGFFKEIRQNMEREATQATKAKLKNAVIDALLGANEILAPNSLIGQEIEVLRTQFAQQSGGQMDASQLPAEMFKPQAEKRVLVGMVFKAVVDKFSITASDEAVSAYIDEIASVYQEPQTVVDYYKNNQEQMNQVIAAVMEEAVIAKVLEASTVTEAEVSYEDAIKSEAAKAAEERQDEKESA